MLPLEGIRVIDLTLEVAGPTCTMILADLGADTIKVERPGTGDHARAIGLYNDRKLGAYFFQFNRNKRSLALDLKKPQGKEVFLELVKTADVVVENYSAGVVQRLGIDYAHAKKVNERIVYCSISGFGKIRPGAQPSRKALNAVVMGEAGLLSHYDARTLKPTDPMKPQVAFVDLGTGMNAAIAVQAALIARAKTGKGQYIEVDMIDTAISWREDMAMFDTNSMETYTLLGPDRPFKTADGWITISLSSDDKFESLFKVLGISELLSDPDVKFFNSRPKYEKYWGFIPRVEASIASRKSAELLEKLIEVGVPCGKVNTLDDIFADPFLQKKVLKLTHPISKKEIRVPNVQYYFSDTPVGVRLRAPLLGEHSSQVLEELGYSGAEITDLEKQGVIQTGATIQ